MRCETRCETRTAQRVGRQHLFGHVRSQPICSSTGFKREEENKHGDLLTLNPLVSFQFALVHFGEVYEENQLFVVTIQLNTEQNVQWFQPYSLSFNYVKYICVPYNVSTINTCNRPYICLGCVRLWC